jgi:hypothetical protein
MRCSYMFFWQQQRKHFEGNQYYFRNLASWLKLQQDSAGVVQLIITVNRIISLLAVYCAGENYSPNDGVNLLN